MRQWRALKRDKNHVSNMANRRLEAACTRVKTLTPTEAAYLAGLLDSDGGVYATFKRNYRGLRKRYSTVSIYVVNTDIRMIQWVIHKTGVGSLVAQRPSATRYGIRPIYRWDVGSQLAAVILRQIKEYLVIKREQADLALELAALKLQGSKHFMASPERHPEIVIAIQTLNRKTGKTGSRVLSAEDTP